MSATTARDVDLEQLGINVIRGLAMDGPQKANSGHPGTAMALAPLAHVLWTRIMKYDPRDPDWPDRDRFVLSLRPRVHPPVLDAVPDRLRPRARGPRASSASCTAAPPGTPRCTTSPGSR